MFIARERVSAVAVAGALSKQIRWRNHGLCLQIIVTPLVASTTFDFSVQDSYGQTIFERTDLTGPQAFDTNIPVFQDLTATIANASLLTETFTFMFTGPEYYVI